VSGATKPTARAWLDDRIDRLCNMLRQGETTTTIASALDVTRGAVSGQINRMRAARDPRVPSQIQRKPKTTGATRQLMDDLADLMAEGCPSISEAARRLGLGQSHADQLWQRIRKALGPQAR
jgi:hypothetical protein